MPHGTGNVHPGGGSEGARPSLAGATCSKDSGAVGGQLTSVKNAAIASTIASPGKIHPWILPGCFFFQHSTISDTTRRRNLVGFVSWERGLLAGTGGSKVFVASKVFAGSKVFVGSEDIAPWERRHLAGFGGRAWRAITIQITYCKGFDTMYRSPHWLFLPWQKRVCVGTLLPTGAIFNGSGAAVGWVFVVAAQGFTDVDAG